MEHQERASSQSIRLKRGIIIFAVLFVLSAGGLSARYLYLACFAPAQTSVTVPDNLIGVMGSRPEQALLKHGSTEAALAAEPGCAAGFACATDNSTALHPVDMGVQHATRLELYQGKTDANETFEAHNMLPGDMVTKYFCVKAHCDADITLFFQTNITEQTRALGDALHIKVTHLETGKVMCDASFSKANGKELSVALKKAAAGETTAYFQIDAFLDHAVGNAYQAALLEADFAWYVREESGLTPPQTGGNTNLALWSVLMASSFLLILFLLMQRRRGDGQHE